MTIDEAIIHAREVAECRDDMCEECRQEHEQLADWLEELKELRSKNAELHDELISLDAYRLGKNYGYNKAIGDMISIIIEMRDTATAMMWAESESACDRFIAQAEQLKGGGATRGKLLNCDQTEEIRIVMKHIHEIIEAAEWEEEIEHES